MKPEQWQQIERVYHAALEHAPDARAAFLVEACANDSDLRREVEELLRFDDEAETFMQDNAAVAVAQQLDSEELQTTQTLLTGQQLGAYKILAPLGKGGMGEVHLAFDTRLERKVALKLLPREVATNLDRLRRFVREAKAASALNHPHVATVYEIGESNGMNFIAMEYVEGQTLAAKIKGAPLATQEVVAIGSQIADALDEAHRKGITHRDLKPANVMLNERGQVKVLDFGLAKFTATRNEAADTLRQEDANPHPSTLPGLVMGTSSYMSPEQARGLPVDTRSDIFSLGIVLYEMMTGQRPFVGATTIDVLTAILGQEPPPLSVHRPEAPLELQRIVSQALRKDREARYQQSKDLLFDLKSLKQELEFEAKPRGAPAAVGNAPSPPTTTQKVEAVTNEVSAPHTTSSAEYLMGEIKRHKLGVILTVVMLLAVVAAAVYFSSFGGRADAIESLAVLPFVNVGANAEAEYLSDGITDELINSLSRLPKLKMMSRNSVFRYKGKENDAQQVGKTLGVRAVLAGKMTQRGDELIISAELVDVRDNSHLWGEKYSYKLSNLLAVQTDLAHAVSQQLRLQLSSAEQQQLAKRGTDNPEAYELYLKGHFYKNSLLQEIQERAIEYLQQAIAKDARFALPYAELVDVYVGLATRGATYTISHQEAVQKAKSAAAKAVELNDTLAEVHFSLAQIARAFDWDWNTAEREFQRTLALSPNYADAHHFYAHLLVAQGRFAEALAESQRALALDPLDVGMNFHLGWHYFRTRQDAQAVVQLRKTLELDPNFSGAHAVLGLAYGELGQYPEAFAELQKNQDLKGIDLRGNWGRIYALAGQRDEAQKLLTQLLAETQLPDKHVSPYNIAVIYTSLGEKEQAFAWLEKALAERDGNLPDPGLKTDRLFDNLRSDPRFADLVRRIGLTP